MAERKRNRKAARIQRAAEPASAHRLAPEQDPDHQRELDALLTAEAQLRSAARVNIVGGAAASNERAQITRLREHARKLESQYLAHPKPLTAIALAATHQQMSQAYQRLAATMVDAGII